jgi:hypothetical protein
MGFSPRRDALACREAYFFSARRQIFILFSEKGDRPVDILSGFAEFGLARVSFPSRQFLPTGCDLGATRCSTPGHASSAGVHALQGPPHGALL